ncbi:MAG: T9SS type A sorting domain-containing protein [Bacteroidota bacterium]
MNRYVLYILLLSPFFSLAQNRNSIWCFGDSAGIDFRNPGNPVPITSVVRSRSNCSSIADTGGNLLFYVADDTTLSALGGRVYNRNHQQMPLGWGLITANWNHEMIIVPMPGNPDKYYIFHTSTSQIFGIYYSIIDMTMDNGFGDVAQANICLTQESVLDGVAAVRHANGRDWWLIYAINQTGTATHDNKFYMYLITPEGISAPEILNIGDIFLTNLGDLSFSNDGSKMLFSTITGLIEVFDFDRCSGIFSNATIVEPEYVSSRTIASSALSPDKNLVYVSSNDYISYLYQYDLRANPISSSRDTLCTFSNLHNVTGMLRLAPDNKIYLSNIYYNFIINPFPYADSIYNTYNMNLSVINAPDSVGAACNFQPYSFYLGGKRTYFGLPNNPNFELGPVQGSVCDSLISVQEISSLHGNFSVFPNPFYNKISLHPFLPTNKKVALEIENETGQLVFNKIITFADQEVDLSFLPQGIYFLRLTGNEFSEVKRLVRL